MDIIILVNEYETMLKKYEDKITDIMVDLSLEFGIVVSLYAEQIKNAEIFIAGIGEYIKEIVK